MQHRIPGRWVRFTLAAVACVAASSAVTGVQTASAAPSPTPVAGSVSAAGPARAWDVQAWVSGIDGAPARKAGSARTDRAGNFRLEPTSHPDARQAFYLTAAPVGRRDAFTMLATVSPTVPTRVVINEPTTVAAGYALAQFVNSAGVNSTDVSGAAPGVRNAASMAANLADPSTGRLGATLRSAPNGSQTSTMAAFTSLSNAVSACTASADGCAALRSTTTTPLDGRPSTLLDAMANMAKSPSINPAGLFAVSLRDQVRPGGLPLPPPAWTLALRFDGGGGLLAGPGNFAIGEGGDVWVNANYQFAPDPRTPVCDGKYLFRFAPNGTLVGGRPLTGGGLSGAGYGITRDHDGDIWVSNFGFAAPAPGCPTDRQPPHNSMSEFSADGRALSPATGYTEGAISWPQGMATDRNGSIWTANCATDSLTVYPAGDPRRARNIDPGVQQPFDIVDNGRALFVSGLQSSSIAVLDRNGRALRAPITGPQVDNPLGLATDARGTVWVANSGVITLPCPDRPTQTPSYGSVTAFAPDGRTLAGPLRGGGITIPWGITTDGDGNVWVANFAGKRVSKFCGADASTCPPGKRTGDAISPDVTGYFFDGLTRSTAVIVDPSGNLWATNNWKEVPLQTNPGGLHVIAFVGAAAPVPLS
ncbi:sugar lactone lactonase YvrE [Gordonia terrae]